MVLYRENFDRPSQEAPAGPQAPVRIRRTSAKVPASLPPSHHSDNRARSTSSTPLGSDGLAHPGVHPRAASHLYAQGQNTNDPLP